MAFDRAARRLAGPLRARRWVCCAIGVSAGLSSCGGRATDGLEPDGTEPGASSSGNEPALVRPIRETCEDNPLLAGCPYANTRGPATPSPGRAESPREQPLYVAAARNVLVSRCGACHGAPLTAAQASAAINYIDDWNQLIAAGLIEKCSPQSSRVIEVMRSGEMPPSSSGVPAVPVAEIEVVAAAIELDCNDE
jgi:mono/diheme cytochrome c family protein